MTLKDLVLDHLKYTFEEESWQPPLAQAIEGLTAAQAAWKPAPQRHSIWQIVRHVTHWKRGVLDAWDGRPHDFAEMERRDWEEISGNDAAWQAEARALHEVSRQLWTRVQAADDAVLTSLMPTYTGSSGSRTKVPRAIRIVRMATHDIYHAGQIRYIRALQGV